MPGVIPLEDAQKLVTDRLQQHGQDALQALQDANQPPLQNTQLPVEVPGPQIDPNEIIQRLQQHAQGVFDAAQQANQPPLQNVQIDPNEIVSRLQQHAQDTLASMGQTLAPEPPQQQPDTSAQAAVQTPQTTSPSANAQTQVGPSVAPGGDLRDYAKQAALKAGIDPDIFLKQIDQESGFNPAAKSGAGAIGIAQFMPATAQGMGIDPTDPYAALDAAAQLDAQNLKKYGGDYAKALAAYNAGPGNVDQYGGVPPFEETQRYVRNILGGAASAVGTAVDTARGTVANAVLPTLSQFGDRELNSAEAYSACGPAAAVRFAQMFGRNPTLREAVDLAKNVGWTADTGMAGLQSESKLFDEMNIPHRVIGADWQAFAREAQSGNPVTLSTPGHYFTADAYDPKTGAFHVGSSGTDLRQGKEWMTPAEMEAVMGPLQGGLAADNPNIPGTSPLSQGTRPAPAPTNIVEQGASVLAGGLQQVDSAVKNAAQNVGGAISSAVADPNAAVSNVGQAIEQNQANPPLMGVRNQIANAPVVGGALGMLRGPELLSDEEILQQPQADTARQLLEQFRQASVAKGLTVPPVTDQDVAGAARTMLEGQAIAMTGRGIGREPLPAEPGAVTPPSAAPAEPASTRMYHGTGAAFDRPGQFSDESLYGPGYYVTSDPRVAGGNVAKGGEPVGTLKLADDITPVTRSPGEVLSPGYAQERTGAPLTVSDVSRIHSVLASSPEMNPDVARYIGGSASPITSELLGMTPDAAASRLRATLSALKMPMEQQDAVIARALPMDAGPNVRAVDVPKNLKLLDVEATISPDEVRAIAATTPPNSKLNAMIAIWDKSGKINDLPGQYVYSALNDVGGGRVAPGNVEANRILQAAGYDGITYQGGSRIPMTDATGEPIEHQATVVFPESLDKIRNAISGRQGGAVDPLLAARLGGTVAGGAAGYASTPEDASPEERIARTAGGVGAGLLATNTAAGFAGAGPLERQVFENLRSLRETRFPPTRPSQPPTRGPIAQAVDLTKQSMLSNPATHIANVIGNTIELARQPVALTLGGRGADAVAGVSAVGRALPEAVGAAVSALRGRQLATLERPGGTIGGPGVGGAVKSSVFRALSASDAFTRTLGEYQGMAAEASRLLREAGMSASDPQAETYLARHATDLYREGTRAGAQSVFGRVASTEQGTGVLDNVFRAYSNEKEKLLASPRLRDQAGGALMDFGIPFSGVPVQMLQIGLNRLPVAAQATGAIRTIRALRAGNMGAAKRAFGETTLETMIQLAIAKNVGDGNITGPDDPEHPNSVRVGGNWMSMNEMGAYALPMQIMASWADGYEKGGHDVPPSTPGATDLEKLTNYFGPRFGAALNASLKPFQQGIPGENLIRFVSNLGQGGATGAGLGLAQDAVSRVTVPGAARFVENLTDPVARDINRKGVASLWEGTMANWPGLAQQLPAKIDPTTGDVLNKVRSGAGILVGGQQDVESPITQEANRLKKEGYAVNPPKVYPDTVTISGAQVKLSPDEQRKVTMITGKTLGDFADRLTRPDYQNSTDNRKAQLMQSYLNAAERTRLSAVRQVLGQPELRRRVLAGGRTVGRLTTQTAAPEVPFLSSSGLSADEQQQLAGVAG
jgi:soluble lytic murein transglycosylase-like protein